VIEAKIREQLMPKPLNSDAQDADVAGDEVEQAKVEPKVEPIAKRA